MPSVPAPVLPAAPAPASLDVPAAARFSFPAGLYGFAECREFALVGAGRPGLWWLQSADDAALAFLLADPFPFFAGYAPDVPEAELAQLGEGAVPPAEQVAALVVVTLPGGGSPQPTANLRAPVLLDTRAQRGRQVVLPEEARGVAEPIALA